MANKPKLLIVTAVWGEWHLRAHYEVNLPTLMAAGNFPALAERCDIRYLIYTSRHDRVFVESASANEGLRRLMKVDVRLLNDAVLEKPIAAHHLAWSMAIEEAKRDGSLILLMPPDVAWADNSFRTVGLCLEQGYRAIFMTYLRAEEKSFSALIRSLPKAPDGSLAVPPSRMVELCLNCLHPLMAAYSADSEHFPVHPEMMIWPVPGEGLLLRILAREMFLFDPSKVELNRAQLPARPLAPGDGCFIADSDELFAVSLAPHGKDADWHLTPRRVDPIDIGEWWLNYDSPINDFVVSHRIRWHFTPVTDSRWRAIEHRSNLTIRRAAGVREGFRFWQVARRLGLPTAAGLIALATHTGTMARALVGRDPSVVLLPTEEAFEALPPQYLEFLCSHRGANAFADMIRRHIIPLDHSSATTRDPLRDWAKAGRNSIRHGIGAHDLALTPEGDLKIAGNFARYESLIETGPHQVYTIGQVFT